MELSCSGFKNSARRVLALGVFDGVHIGHGALLNKTEQRALELSACPSVLTFDIHPDRLVFGSDIRLLGTNENRRELLHRCYGINDVLFLHFDEEMKTMLWHDFVFDIVRKYSAVWIVAGEDFTFGSHGEGNAEKLFAWCGEHNVGCDIIPAVKIDGTPVSSTWIRTLIESGDMEKANHLLGHPHCISGTVCPGQQLGRTISVPTINLFFPEGVVVPQRGVYASKVILEDGSEYLSVTNIGTRPTVGNETYVNAETHLLDFSGDLYNTSVRVDLYAFLRPEQKFSSLEELRSRILRDIEAARNLFSSGSL